jgi:hypothetical protein
MCRKRVAVHPWDWRDWFTFYELWPSPIISHCLREVFKIAALVAVDPHHACLLRHVKPVGANALGAWPVVMVHASFF